MEANERDGGSRSFVLVQTPEPLRSKSARAVVAERGGSASAHGGRAEEGASAGADSRAEDTEFPTISELTAERIRRAADIHCPGLRFTRLDVVEDE